VEELARVLGGELACSKPVATDQRWFPEERIVGLSGKKCKPQLAICLGISGQVQFNVGIRDARILVAVNNDPGAYIFQISDYGIAADLHEVVPRLVKGLKAM
jgi:electron transfer flavoprotein alpha subunit